MDSRPPPFESGRSFASQFTARRMNDLQDRQLRVKYSGRGSRVSRLGNQIFVETPRPLIPAYPPLKAALQPGSDVSTSGSPMYTITYGTYGTAVPTIDGTALSADVTQNIITLAASDQVVYIQCDFTYDQYGNKTITDAEIMSATTATYDALISTITDGGMGTGGSGTLYENIFGVVITAPVGIGPYTVKAAPGVTGSQNFNICLAGPSVSGPWLI